MPLKNPFKLEKLKIVAFADRKRNGHPIGTFEAMFNPESITQKYEIQYGKGQGMGANNQRVDYSRSKPTDLNLKLILDGTGLHEAGVLNSMGVARLEFPAKSVSARVEDFLKLTFRVNGDIHEPNSLTVIWGKFQFACRLGSVDIKYTNFDRDGTPLRAELNIKLLSDINVIKQMRKKRLNSPDMTHSRIVKAGDTLPLLTKEIYGSAQYYWWVAEQNGLDDIRCLTPGQRLVFPPLEPAASP